MEPQGQFQSETETLEDKVLWSYALILKKQSARLGLWATLSTSYAFSLHIFFNQMSRFYWHGRLFSLFSTGIYCAPTVCVHPTSSAVQGGNGGLHSGERLCT